MLLDSVISDIDLQVIGYSILSLTLVRMLPVAVSMIGGGAKRETVAFVGWFGPRGLATIVFALTIVDESGLAGTQRILTVATLTVLFSVFARGMTAPWLTDRYVRWLSENRDQLTFEIEAVEIGVHTRPPRHRISHKTSPERSEP